jgi:hypothetical protein
MMFEPGLPWYMLDPSEIHAAGRGLMDGLKVWQRKPAIAYNEIDTLPISPEWKDDLKHKYHYYYTAYEAPEILGFLFTVSYFAYTNLPGVMNIAGKIYGVI